MKKTLRCPRCNRAINYIRITTNEGVCHQCGIIPPDEMLIARQRMEEQARPV